MNNKKFNNLNNFIIFLNNIENNLFFYVFKFFFYIKYFIKFI